jgi:hypothetical protein
MGCARWKGDRLKEVLDRVGLKKGSDRDRFQWRRSSRLRKDAGLHQEHPGVDHHLRK